MQELEWNQWIYEQALIWSNICRLVYGPYTDNLETHVLGMVASPITRWFKWASLNSGISWSPKFTLSFLVWISNSKSYLEFTFLGPFLPKWYAHSRKLLYAGANDDRISGHSNSSRKPPYTFWFVDPQYPVGSQLKRPNLSITCIHSFRVGKRLWRVHICNTIHLTSFDVALLRETTLDRPCAVTFQNV